MSGGVADDAMSIGEFALGPIEANHLAAYACASGDSNPIHLDEEAARASGLGRPIVHGMLMMGQFERLLRRWRKDISIGALQCRFLRPAPVGSRLVVSGSLTARRVENGLAIAAVRFTVRDCDGVRICVGEAEVEWLLNSDCY